ncbi:MAG: HAMP domain-containing histidine kinase [Bacteroidales bacterium]|jgi:signal transduction histidine kinase|nr:HAMP domain-containing histidine kinase [Bacteroidales bacterium]
MKFLKKINLNYLIPLTLVLLIVSVAGYFILRIIITYGAKERLLSKEYLVEQQIKNTGEIPNLHPVIEVQKTEIKPDINPSFKKVTIWNEMEKEDEKFIEYSSGINIGSSWYIVKIRQSSFENEDILLILALTLFILLLSAFMISFLSARRMNRTVWSGFERNLHEIENYSLRINKDISLERSDIEEFERLNIAVRDFTSRLKSDYLMLKEFTENASHEIQTPLSVALMNLEEILQHDIKEDVFKKVVTVINSLKRLTKLNQSLILLAKIDNMQFEKDTEISLNEIILRKKEDLSAFIDAKNLDVEIRDEGNFLIRMDVYLSEILIGNLFTNAVDHNITNGIIRVFIKPGFLQICNTGENHALTDKNIFNRFVSGNKKSPGLGLAIVRQICETHNLDVHYVKDELHCFTIRIKT